MIPVDPHRRIQIACFPRTSPFGFIAAEGRHLAREGCPNPDLFGRQRQREPGHCGSRAFDEKLDGVGEMFFLDVVVAARDAEAVRLDHHVGVAAAFGRLETVGGEFDQQPERVLK
jgi:hypothetical protein